jgi:hypothetical protein
MIPIKPAIIPIKPIPNPLILLNHSLQIKKSEEIKSIETIPVIINSTRIIKTDLIGFPEES